jgi:hypothetical protein
MAQNDELQLALKIEADASIDNAIKKLDKVGLVFDDVADAAHHAGKVMTSAILDAEEAERRLEKQAKRTNDVLDEQGKKSSKINPLDAAGSFAGASGQVGGALEDLGLKGAGQVGQIGAAIGDAAENLPKLAEAAKDLPKAVGSALSALGPAGIVVAAVAAGVTALVLTAQKGAEEMKKAAAARLAAEEEIANAIAGGLTTEAAQERLEELKRLQELQTELVVKAEEERKAAFEQALQDTGGLDASARFRELLGLTDSGELDAAVKRREDAVSETAAEIEQLTAKLGDNALAANDAAEAEARLAEERTASILAEAQQAGELATLKARVTDLTQEQIDGELEALKLREAGLKAEIAALNASGDTSEAVANKIAELNNQLGFLGEQSDVLKKARPNARSEAAEKAAEEAKKAQEDAARESERAAQEGKRNAENAAKERENAAKAALKQQQDFENAVTKLREDTHHKRIDQEINNARAIEDIIRDFGDQREDALAEQSFLSLAQINKEEKRANRDQSIENKRAKEDINREAQRANNDLLRQQQQYQQQRVKIETAGYNAGLRGATAYASGLMQIGNQLAKQFQSRLDSKLTGDSQFRQRSSYVQSMPRGN